MAEQYLQPVAMTLFAIQPRRNPDEVRGYPIHHPPRCGNQEGARVITLLVEEYPDLARPSAIEVEILVAIISQGMGEQARDLKFDDRRKRSMALMSTVNFVIPALIVSIYPGACVRVLYCYIVNQRLHVHFTDIHRLTEENFDEMLEENLRWAFPIAYGEATKLIALRNIIEEEEAAGDDGCDDYDSDDSEDRPGRGVKLTP